MNRETIIAVVLGILLGVGIGFFVLFQSSRTDQTKVIPVNTDTENKKVVKNTRSADEAVLEVKEPNDMAVVNSNSIKIKGTAEKNSLIVIQSPINNKVFKIDKETYETTFPVALGENMISINAYSKSSTPQEVTLKVYYVEE
jgi:hypothetical protein